MPGSKPELRLGQRLAYAGAVVGGNLTDSFIVTWALYAYAPPVGHGQALAPITLVAAALLFGRVVDAATNPIIGFWSDRTRHRWGRRIPFLAFAGLPMALGFIALWFPPVTGPALGAGGSVANGLYAAGILGLFYFCFTSYFCPHGALLPEITGDSGERVAISIFMAIAGLVSTAAIGVGSGFLIERYGFRVAGPVMGLAALPFLYGPVAAIREKPRGQAEEITISFKEAVLESLRNRPFVIWVVSSIFGLMAQNVLMATIPYFVTVVLGGTESQIGYLMGGAILVAMVSFPFITKLSTKLGKGRVYQASLLAGAVVLGLLFFVGRVPVPLSPMAQAVVLVGLAGLALGPVLALPQAILADTIDYEYERTGKRRSAMFLGLQGVTQKATIAFAPMLMSALFTTFGYSAARPLGVYLTGPLGGLLFFIGWLVFRAYPLKVR